MVDRVAYYLNSTSDVKEFELLQISHPSFTQTFYIVRNKRSGLTVTLENAASQFFTYYPLQIKGQGAKDDLDYALQISLGDLGELLPTQFDAVAAANTFNIKPTVIYRTYRSDDLTAPMFGPLTLEVDSFAFKREGATFVAKAPSVNINKTGEFYTFERFPMLRGFL
jgi:hypothetical protein